MLSSSLASGRSFLKVLGVEEEPHLVTVLMEKMSAVKQLQTLSEDMSGWLSGSKQGIALVCVLLMCLYYWSLGAADTQFTEKQAYYERIGEISTFTCFQCERSPRSNFDNMYDHFFDVAGWQEFAKDNVIAESTLR